MKSPGSKGRGGWEGGRAPASRAGARPLFSLAEPLKRAAVVTVDEVAESLNRQVIGQETDVPVAEEGVDPTRVRRGQRLVAFQLAVVVEHEPPLRVDPLVEDGRRV